MALKSKAMRKGGRKVRKTLKNKKYKKGGSVENTPGAKPVQHNTLGNMMHGISSGFKGIGNMMGFRKSHEHPGAPQPGAPQPVPPQPVPPQQGGRKVRKSKKYGKGGMFATEQKQQPVPPQPVPPQPVPPQPVPPQPMPPQHVAPQPVPPQPVPPQHAGKRKTKRNTKRKYSRAKKSRKN
jgi:outer membrane biosynthesis protein TonB